MKCAAMTWLELLTVWLLIGVVAMFAVSVAVVIAYILATLIRDLRGSGK